MAARILAKRSWASNRAFFVAAVWYGLLSQQISVPSEPTFAPDVPFDQVLEGFYDWYATTLMQERLDTMIAIVGCLALIGVALALREVFGRGWSAGILGAAAVTLGSVLWIVGNVIQIGGVQRAWGYFQLHWERSWSWCRSRTLQTTATSSTSFC